MLPAVVPSRPLIAALTCWSRACARSWAMTPRHRSCSRPCAVKAICSTRGISADAQRLQNAVRPAVRCVAGGDCTGPCVGIFLVPPLRPASAAGQGHLRRATGRHDEAPAEASSPMVWRAGGAADVSVFLADHRRLVWRQIVEPADPAPE